MSRPQHSIQVSLSMCPDRWSKSPNYKTSNELQLQNTLGSAWSSMESRRANDFPTLLQGTPNGLHGLWSRKNYKTGYFLDCSIKRTLGRQFHHVHRAWLMTGRRVTRG
jgi:hypothetical protein